MVWPWVWRQGADRSLVVYFFTGPYAPLYWEMLLFNVVLPQIFWFPAARQSILLICIVSILINVGMWLERSHRLDDAQPRLPANDVPASTTQSLLTGC